MITFSGLTVAAALASLYVFPARFLYSIGVGGAVVALTSALVCLTVLPALLAMLGPRVNALAPRALQRTPSRTRWTGWAQFVLRHPASITIVIVATMVTPRLPFLRVELTRADAAVAPQREQRPPGRLDPEEALCRGPSAQITVVVKAPETARPSPRAQTELAAMPGVEAVARPCRPATASQSTCSSASTPSPIVRSTPSTVAGTC